MRYTRLLALALPLAMTVGLWSCSGTDDGTMPITTSSDLAREEFYAGRELSEKLRAQEAIPYFERAIEADPGFAMAHIYLALASQTPKEFFESYDRAVSLLDNAGKGEQLWILAVQAGVNGDARKQEEYLQKLEQMYPRDVRAVSQLGNYYFGQQDFDKAIAQYKKAEQIDPEFSQIYNQMGYSYRILGQYDKAEEAFKKYIALIPDDPNPYDSYAELLLKSGQFDKSIEMYRKALQISPDFVFSHIGIASNLMLQGNHDAARAQLDTMFQQSTNDGRKRQALAATAAVWVDQGNYDSAIAAIERQYALAQADHDSSAMANDWLQLVAIVGEAGRLDKAEEYLDKYSTCIHNASVSDAVKENSVLNTYYFEARIAVERGDIETARSNQKEFADWARRMQNPGTIRVAHELAGIIALAEKEYATAIAELKQASLRNPYNLFRLGQAFEGMGDLREARSYYHQAAHFNETISFAYAFVRQRALEREAALATS
ncbi:tetratricopeptide repeat protein [bacterium]|nr:tetratricopeptide repeat protein [bacterium]